MNLNFEISRVECTFADFYCYSIRCPFICSQIYPGIFASALEIYIYICQDTFFCLIFANKLVKDVDIILDSYY